MNTNMLVILALPALCLLLFAVALVVWASRTLVETGQKQETWPAFAQSIGGVFTPGGAGKPDEVAGRIDEWPFVLDTYVAGNRQSLINYTRLRALFLPHQPFEAILYTPEADDPLPGRAALVMVPVTGLGPEVIVKSTDAAKIEALLGDAALAQWVQAVRPLNLQIRRRRHWQGGGVSNSVYEVHAQCRGVITDAARLQAMHALVAACLRLMLRQGLAARSMADPP